MITLDFVNISTVFVITCDYVYIYANCCFFFFTATDFEIKDPDRPVCEVIIKMTSVHVCFKKQDVNILESTPPEKTPCLYMNTT